MKYTDINYQIEFFTDWHCGSGLAAGADVDALVVKDADGIPYVPGKTVKGLLREAVDDIINFRTGDRQEKMRELAVTTFGYFDGKTDIEGQRAKMTRGTAHFTNATLPEADRKAIVRDKLQPYLFRTVTSTAIDSNGTTKAGSLRKAEVTVPCTMEGQILGLPDNEEFLRIISDAMRYVKRLGQNRNRGLGRCAISRIVDTDKKSGK